jgi:hypothetical protein
MAWKKRICGRFSPLQTETANESNDNPMARRKTVINSIRKEMSDKTIKNTVLTKKGTQVSVMRFSQGSGL